MKKIPSSLEKLSKFVGNTPLVEVTCEFQGKKVTIFVKYEAWNFSGSIKDRMALSILKSGYFCGGLQPGETIIEATSGNTGISFAAMGAFMGHPVEIYMPSWLSEERKRILRFYGAILHEITVEQGGFLKCIELAGIEGSKEGSFCPKQFENSNNPAAHLMTTAPEMERGLLKAGYADINAFVAGVGTGGTIMGFFRHFSQIMNDFQAFPVFPVNNSDGSHRIEGIGDSFVPKILSLSELGRVIRVSDSDAIAVSRNINKMGLSVGISSGANLLAAAQKAYELGSQAVVGTVFSDCNKKYLSTDLCSGSEESLSVDFKILDYKIIG